MKRLSKLGLASLIVLSLVIVPVSAQRPDNVGAQNRPDVEQIRERAEANAEEARTSAEERKSEIMAQVEQRKDEIKQEVCERRQTALANAMPRLSQSATSVKQAMDTVYERVAGFYEEGQLTVENYDELVTNVETAKANAEAALQTIDEFDFELDCDNPNVGEQLDGFRASVGEARTELKAYQESLVELISSLRAEAASGDSVDEGENSEESEGVENE